MPGDARREAERPPWLAVIGTITLAPLFRRSGDRARSVSPYGLEARRAVLRLGSVEMDRRGPRHPPHSPAPRLPAALRARGARDASTLRPTPAPRRQRTVPLRAQSGLPVRRVHHRRAGP